MKKSVLFLVAILVLSMFAFTACANIPKFDRECAEHIDVDEDYVCDECQKELTPPGPCQHVDENKDHVCDLCEEVVSECADGNNDHGCDVCGKTLSECVNADGNHACDVCAHWSLSIVRQFNLSCVISNYEKTISLFSS